MKLTALQWLVLDNYLHGWPFATNANLADATKARTWCEIHGLIRDGKITDSGRGALLANNHRNWMKKGPTP